MFERIFVPLDGTEHAERALPVATRIARATGGTLIFVFKPIKKGAEEGFNHDSARYYANKADLC